MGTGPGPSLFALSDTYLSLKLFGEESGDKFLQNQIYNSDYVEKSSGFRNWLHHFTEVANFDLPENNFPWIVPYHHGHFDDFHNIQFETYQYYEDFNNQNKSVPKIKKNKHRYNIVIFSNFLTQVSQVRSLKKELQYCMRFMRNNGKLIVSGGTGRSTNDKNYPKLYGTLREILLENVYSNYKFYAQAKYIKVRRNKLSFGYKNRFGEKIKELNKSVIQRFIDHDAIECIPEGTREIFLKSVEDSYDRPIYWEFHVYGKSVHLKKGFKSWISNNKRY